jgi:hypothetical protein
MKIYILTKNVIYEYVTNFTCMKQHHILNVNSVLKNHTWKSLNRERPRLATISNRLSKCLPSVVSLYGTQSANVRKSNMDDTTSAPVPWLWNIRSTFIVWRQFAVYMALKEWSVDLVACNIALNTSTVESNIKNYTFRASWQRITYLNNLQRKYEKIQVKNDKKTTIYFKNYNELEANFCTQRRHTTRKYCMIKNHKPEKKSS